MDNNRGQTPQNEKPSSTHQETVVQGSETEAISAQQHLSLQPLTQQQEQMAPAHGHFAPVVMGQPRPGGGEPREVMRSAVGGVVGGNATGGAAAAASAQSSRGGSGAASSLFLEGGGQKREPEGVPDAIDSRAGKKTRVEGR